MLIASTSRGATLLSRPRDLLGGSWGVRLRVQGLGFRVITIIKISLLTTPLQVFLITILTKSRDPPRSK